jgi:hypothetical protein
MKNKPHNRLKIIFTSGSKNFLLSLADALKPHSGGRVGQVYNSHRSYQLLYRSIGAIKVLDFMYNSMREKASLCLDRKYKSYKDLIANPEHFRCGNIFDRSSRIWNYNTNWRRTQVA